MNKKGNSSITDEWGSFIAVPTSFVRASKPLTDKARWLFVLLREYTNGETGVAFPSYDTIRERTGWGRSQISNAIKCLGKHGWLTRQHQFGGVTQYRLVKPIEPNSTETKLLETPQTAIANNPKTRRQKSQTETPIVPIRDAIKIESTKIEFTESIGDVDTPHAPSQSFECETPLSLLGDSQNGFAETVHAQLDELLIVSPALAACLDQVSPLTRFNSVQVPLTSPSQLQIIQNGQKDFDELSVASRPLTVHAQQAAVIAPAQNAQLRVLSPLAESTGITASVEAVDQPSDPVSASKRKVSRKATTAKTDSPEEIQRKADHKTLMDTLHTRTGQPILNGGAQAAAVKRILGAYTVEQAIEVLDSQLKPGNWRGPVSWLSVQTQIADYFRRKEQQPQTKLGGNYGQFSKSGGETGESIFKRLCSRRALGDFG